MSCDVRIFPFLRLCLKNFLSYSVRCLTKIRTVHILLIGKRVTYKTRRILKGGYNLALLHTGKVHPFLLRIRVQHPFSLTAVSTPEAAFFRCFCGFAENISVRAPAWGATHHLSPDGIVGKISTRAPAWGAT